MPSAWPPLADARVWVAGHRGMVGSAVWRALEQGCVGDLVGWSSAGLGLADQRKLIELLKALGTEAEALEPRPTGEKLAAASAKP